MCIKGAPRVLKSTIIGVIKYHQIGPCVMCLYVHVSLSKIKCV